MKKLEKELPKKQGFTLRRLEMTRLETFVDAAFAFAITMLVISAGKMPTNFKDLITALKAVPSFIVSFSFLMLFWIGHRKWSRRYGLEDSASTIISLGLVFVMLVYVYPLRLMASALFAWISNGFLPSEFIIYDWTELSGLFIVYGLGFTALTMMLALLYLRARSVAASLHLTTLERIRTNEEIAIWTTMAITGAISVIFAWLMPTRIGIWTGFIYSSLCLTMPAIAIYYAKKIEKVK